MMASVAALFQELSQDIYCFLIAVVFYKLFHWLTKRPQLKVPRIKKQPPSYETSSADEDTDKGIHPVRSRTSSDPHTKNGWASDSSTDHAWNRASRRPMNSHQGYKNDDASSRLKPDAHAFKPYMGSTTAPADDKKVQQSIKRLKNVLQEWKPGEDLECLQDAIAGLAPKDTAMIKSLLDSKVAEKDVELPCPPRDQLCGQSRSTGNAAGHTPPWSRPRDPDDWRSHGPDADTGQQRRQRSARFPIMSPEHIKSVFPQGDSLRSNLLELAKLESARVIMVRKINQLGLNSAALLETYFGAFGTIDRVLVSHSVSKTTSGAKRLRPAALGFVVMSTAEEAKAALEKGEVQIVDGVELSVTSFESHPV